jgi:uncharacterized protein (DUF1015 family)
MAKVIPFRALRYAADRVALERVLTQPYDKITPEMQERYYGSDPHNLVRVILGKPQPSDSEGENVYTRAAAHLGEWRRTGVLSEDKQPAFYIYSQCFTDAAGKIRERRGFIALCRLEDYSAGVILRHEQTHSAPKADRLNLLRATHMHAESIFMLYSDPERRVEENLTAESAPHADVQDEYGVRHRMWQVADNERISALTAAMAEKKLVIADGHHRYETALAYRDEQRAAAGKPSPDARYEYMMMTLVAMESDGLVILPTHRVLSGLPSFDEARFMRELAAYFDLTPVSDLAQGLAKLSAEPPRTAFLGATRSGLRLMLAKLEAYAALGRLTPRQRELDVAALHELVIGRVLGLSAADIRELKGIAYVRDAHEAVERVRSGADVAFLMNPARVEQVRDIAFAGEVMPQKSTDFYPKLLSGLTLYALD